MSNSAKTIRGVNYMKKIEIENKILKKQNQLIRLQSQEIRAEYDVLKERLKNLESEKSGMVEKFSKSQFLELEDGVPKILTTAMKYFESRDGCPFFSDECMEKEKIDCKSIWVKMGSPCLYFVKKISEYVKSHETI